MDSNIKDLLDFLNQAPTAWHAVDLIKKKLRSVGFKEIKERDSWSLEPGGSYFSVRHGSLCAFVLPKNNPYQATILATHTDSPGLKLKPNAEFYKENMVLFGLEIYGSPLISSWFNRDLGLAGQVSYLNQDNHIEEQLVRIDQHPIIIPQLAIHLDRQVNEQGLQVHKQDHLNALACIRESENQSSPHSTTLEKWIHEQVSFKKLLSHDLYVFPLEAARLIGENQELISSYRIDSLNSVHAALTAICEQESNDHTLKIVIFCNHEEIGSETAQGAHSPYLSQQIERIAIGLKASREDYLRLLSQSLCVSIDLAHALSPNHSEKYDPRHPLLLSKGIVIKFNAQQRYATDASSASRLIALCHQEKLKTQQFVSRNDIPCGTTIGPIHAYTTGIPTVDIGCAQLSMHSCREIASCQDHLEMCTLLKKLLQKQEK